MTCTGVQKCCPEGRPEEGLSKGEQELEKQSCLGEGSCKAELADGDVGRATGFEHCETNQTEGNHVHEEFLVKGCGRVAMPGGGAEGMLKIAIERLDVPAHVIEAGQF